MQLVDKYNILQSGVQWVCQMRVICTVRGKTMEIRDVWNAVVVEEIFQNTTFKNYTKKKTSLICFVMEKIFTKMSILKLCLKIEFIIWEQYFNAVDSLLYSTWENSLWTYQVRPLQKMSLVKNVAPRYPKIFLETDRAREVDQLCCSMLQHKWSLSLG